MTLSWKFPILLWVIQFCDGTNCPPEKFGWQCRYECGCNGTCDSVTGHCDNCPGLIWGTGCLLDSRCTYNDNNGRHYQGKRAAGDGGGHCVTWDPRWYKPEKFPDADFKNAGGYCRNPSYSHKPWCYTPWYSRWDWCTIKSCPCPSGRFGVNCASECHCNDNENTCNSHNGSCKHGCHPDFQGFSCQECAGGKYGLYCANSCSYHCETPRVCNNETGSCTCQAGYQPPTCHQECETGKYGLNCADSCSDYCETQRVCNKETGTCTCQVGYKPPTCHQECESGKYGLNCAHSCSDNCETPRVCNKKTGTCTCQAGYKPPTCHQECESGKYGLNCADSCSYHCETLRVCNKKTGTCTCRAGYKPPTCHQVCETGQFGVNCSHTCSNHCEYPGVCNRETGACTCQAGFQPPTCHHDCRDGTFGRNCTGECRCFNSSEACGKTNGSCSQSGCAAGLHGPGCQTACAEGRYGRYCNNLCHVGCNGECDPVSGMCGCKAGYKGLMCSQSCNPGTFGIDCNETCPENCQNTTDCNPKNGTCMCKEHFRGIHCSFLEAQSHEPQTSRIIAGTVAGLLCLILLGGIIIFVWLRRRNGRACDGFRRNKPAEENAEHLETLRKANKGKGKKPDKQSHVAEQNKYKGNDPVAPSSAVDLDAVYCNLVTAFDKNSILVSEFPDYIRFMTDTERGFEDEYKTISIEPYAEVTVGKMEVNRSRNRFRNIVPYDHNRVKLKKYGDDSVKGYINASYIPGYDGSVEFIAAQGPVAETLADFILMVWENDVHLIVMVTALNEDKAKKAKCEQYWPDNKKPRVFNEITVSLRATQQNPHYVTRELILQKGVETKAVRHMQFISWPDHGTPLSPTAFLAYHKEATRHYDSTRGPTLVHCSAGVGRTGTFLAVDYLLKQAEHEGRVSVYKCVTELRKHRVNMVQSLDQYRFIHEALLEALHCGKVFHDVTSFETWMNEHHQEDLNTQFEMLGKMTRVVRPEDTTAGKLEENKKKNRNPFLLPLDKWRPLLMTPVPFSNDYINAVFVKADRRSDGIIATQSPLKHTVNDIWRLIHDYECTVIVALNLCEEEGFPDYIKSDTYGPFKVSVRSSTREENFKKSVVTYSLRGEQLKTIHMATTLDTPEDSLPDIDPFIALAEAAQCARQEDRSGRTVVHCRTGLNHSGLFCALSQICQKIKDEQEVDVFHAVKQIRISRPEFITSLKEYQWLHQAALHYIQSFSTYSNFRLFTDEESAVTV